MSILDNLYDEIKTMNKQQLETFIQNHDNDKITLETLLFIAYDLHGYEPDDKITEQKLKRQHQQKFRHELEKRYKKCVISKKNIDVCEACHIVPFSESESAQKYNINNGLLMSADLHKLFDKDRMSINDEGHIVFAKDLLQQKSYKEFRKYDNMLINLNQETMVNIKLHYEKFLLSYK